MKGSSLDQSAIYPTEERMPAALCGGAGKEQGPCARWVVFVRGCATNCGEAKSGPVAPPKVASHFAGRRARANRSA